jgi:hypothetical protein
MAIAPYGHLSTITDYILDFKACLQLPDSTELLDLPFTVVNFSYAPDELYPGYYIADIDIRLHATGKVYNTTLRWRTATPNSPAQELARVLWHTCLELKSTNFRELLRSIPH